MAPGTYLNLALPSFNWLLQFDLIFCLKFTILSFKHNYVVAAVNFGNCCFAVGLFTGNNFMSFMSFTSTWGLRVSLKLTVSWQTPLSYRNRKSMDWFLYDNGFPHERVNIICYYFSLSFILFFWIICIIWHSCVVM